MSYGASVLYVFTTAVHTSILGALLIAFTIPQSSRAVHTQRPGFGYLSWNWNDHAS